MKASKHQLRLPLTPADETREQRMRRILAGIPKVKRASDVSFNYRQATAIAEGRTA